MGSIDHARHFGTGSKLPCDELLMQNSNDGDVHHTPFWQRQQQNVYLSLFLLYWNSKLNYRSKPFHSIFQRSASRRRGRRKRGGGGRRGGKINKLLFLFRSRMNYRKVCMDEWQVTYYSFHLFVPLSIHRNWKCFFFFLPPLLFTFFFLSLSFSLFSFLDFFSLFFCNSFWKRSWRI